MHFVGIDHSLTAPGLCIASEDGDPALWTFRPGRRRAEVRIAYIVWEIMQRLDGRRCLVAIEGHSFGHNQKGSRDRLDAILDPKDRGDDE